MFLFKRAIYRQSCVYQVINQFPLQNRFKMTMEYFKLAFFSILCISALFWQVHLACDGDEFQTFQERVQMRTFSGSRMHLAPNAFDHEQIFSVLQCLDICLRTTHCFSVDINLDHPRKICRINPLFETRKHFLVKDENWKHVNMSAKHLRKVCPFTLIVISMQCISLHFQKNGIFQILFRKTFLHGYS